MAAFDPVQPFAGAASCRKRPFLMPLIKPISSVEVSTILATTSGLVSSLTVVVGSLDNSHGLLWIGVIGFAMFVAACAIEKYSRPHQQWLRFLVFGWSVGVTMTFTIAAGATAIHAFGSPAMYVWLVLAGMSCGVSLLVRPSQPYPVQ